MSAKPAVVGGFILGALALGVVAIIFFGGTQLFATTSRAVVFFGESVAGLSVGAPVTFEGVQVGRVQKIAIRFSADSMSAQIPVFLELEPDQIIWESKRLGSGEADYARLVKAGLRARLAQQSFVTGQLRVDLNLRPDAPAHLVRAIPGIPEIPAMPSAHAQLRNEL
jgi:paraquat-inducible protein B